MDGSREEAHDVTASEQLRDLVNGFRISQTLHVAAVLNVSDLLADGPLDLESPHPRGRRRPGDPSPAAPCSGLPSASTSRPTRAASPTASSAGRCERVRPGR
jgi:hypothetical protein